MLSQMDWSDVYSSVNVDDAVSSFNSKLRSCFSEAVPVCRPPKKPPWSNARLRNLKRERSKMLKNYCRQKNQFSKRQFDEASRLYRYYNRLLYKRHLCRTEANLRRNPKQFWSFVNSKRKDYGLPSCMRWGEHTASNADEKCELFASHFASVFNDKTLSNDDISSAISSTPSGVVDVDIFDISAEMVDTALTKLKLSSKAGPDGIPSCVLKKCSGLLVEPLRAIFNLSLQHRTFPSIWKKSCMTPVHKKGDKMDIANYRGITSLSAGSKCFEIILNKVILESCKHYISSSQHGFFPKRSVESNLCEFTSYCISNMDSGAQIDAIYTDIKAAFDTVNHDILHAKFQRLGFSERLCDWLKSYLTNRQLYVKIGSAESTTFSPRSGVPQGSNLGPLLFALFFNDVSLILRNGSVLIYADDLKIYLIIRNQDDCYRLQEMLDCFARWCRLNHLVISITKCCVISYRRLKNPTLFNYTIEGTVLNRVDHVKDLGVLLDYQLTFKMHYSDIVERANRQLGFISKVAAEFTDPLCLRALYCSLVRSILEFASTVWSPYEDVWISRLESVQRKFVRYALRNLPWTDPNNLPSYEQRCALIGIETLADRRNASQAVFGAKILRAEIDSPELLGLLQIYAPQRVLRSRQWLRQAPRNTMYGYNDPMNAVSRRFQESFHLFDFNVSTKTFRQRLRRM